MKRRLAGLWLVLLAVLAGVAMCGSKEPGYVWGYVSSAAGYARPGGGNAPHKTYYNVYTMNPALDHATVNINGVTGVYADSVNVDNQDRAIVVADSLEDLGLGRVYTLGLGANDTYESATDDSTFAYALLDTLWAPATCDTMPRGSTRRVSIKMKSGANNWDLAVDGSARPRSLIMHFDPKVPAGSTIVSATLHLNAEATYTSGNDTISATLMSKAGWGSWYHYRGLYNGWSNTDAYTSDERDTWYKYGAKSGYTNQVQYKTNADRHGYHYTTRAPWVPAMSTLNRYYDRGDYTDFSSLGNKNGDGAKRWDLAIDITDCVQAIANGVTNNGIMITPKIASAANRTLATSGFECDQRVKLAGWIDVKYSDKPYVSLLPEGKKFAFVFQTDDGRKTANDAYYQTFADHGGKYTIYACKDFLGTSGIGTAADLLNWYRTGNEIGVHSRSHIYSTVYQINYWGHGSAANGYTAADTTLYAAGWDSMRTSLKPAWMYALGDSLGIPRYSKYWAKSLALPGNGWSPWTQVLCTQLGYQSVRTGQSGVYGLLANPLMGAAFSDTAYCGTGGQKSRAPRNIIMLPTFIGIDAIVGAKANTTITEAEVKANMRKCVEQIKACDIPVLSLYVHDFKTNPSGADYAEGLDQEELDWMLDVVDEEGGLYMTATEYTDFMRANSTWIDRPHNAHRDSTDFFASRAPSGAWIKPDGIDNRFMTGFHDATVSNQFDTTAPPAATEFAAYGQEGQNVLVWTPANTLEAVSYDIYRGISDLTPTYFANTTWPFYVDAAVVNGTPYTYYVRTRDTAGNVSASAGNDSCTPKVQIGFARPPYFAIWFADPPFVGNGVGEWPTAHYNAVLDSLAAFDAVAVGPFAAEGVGQEPFFANFVRDIRIKNPDEIVLMYVNPWMLRLDNFAGQPARNPYKRLKAYADTGADSSGYARDVSHRIVRGWEYRIATTGAETRVINYTRAACADTVAKIWAEAYEKLATGMNGDYTGLFVDDLSVAPGYQMRDFDDAINHWSPFVDVVDADQDGFTFAENEDGPGDQIAFEQFHVNVLKALRREFAQRGLNNRLIVGNTTFGRADVPGTRAVAALSLLDGAMIEGANVWWPGNAASDSTWNKAFSLRSLLTHSQVSPPMEMIMVATDSSAAYQSEVLALASDTWVNVSNDAHHGSRVPFIDGRLPNPGTFGGAVFADGGADPDTLTATWTKLKARMWLSRNPVNSGSSGAILPYVTFKQATHDTLRQSLYWERAGEEGAPHAPLYHTLGGDEEIAVSPYINPLPLRTWLPSDFSHFRIVREWDDDPPGIDTKMVYPEDMNIWYQDGESDIYGYMDTGLTNGVEYCYKMTAIDVLGNESSETSLNDQCRTPVDITPPPDGVTNVVCAGGDGFIALDWEYPNAPADLDHFKVTRRLAEPPYGFSYSIIGNPTISAYNDSSAVPGVHYQYVVYAVDDDGWSGVIGDAPGEGIWYGSAPQTYLPPGQVRAFSNRPSPYNTQVLIYPASDVTGLTSYSLYRGEWNGIAGPDTSVCTLLATGLTPDALNGYVYVDSYNTNHTPLKAFQYTACALYSGNRSPKCAFPARAYSDGGFAAQTPTCYASGGSSNFVWWQSVGGADQTQIQRSTNGTTWSDLTTEGSGVYTYADVSSVCGTAYYYRCRQYDNETATWTSYSASTGAFQWACAQSGDPQVTGVTGTVRNGLSVTIAGNNFGSKAIPAPRAWDTFESGGNNGDVLSLAAGWTKISEDVNVATQHSSSPRYTTDKAHAGSKSLLCSFANPTDHSSFWVQDTARLSQQFYIDAWMWYDHGPVYTRSWKPWDMYDNTGNSSVVVDWHGDCNGTTIQVSCYTGGAAIPGQVWSDVNSEVNADIVDFEGGWHHAQIYCRTSIPAGTRTGVVWIALDGEVVTDRTDMLLLASDATRTWGELGLGYYNTRDQRDCPGTVGNAYMWWDNVYVDSSRARVEIGTSSTNPVNPTYAQCDHREIQIPSAWAANGTSVTATVNTGSFANGTAYLFVVNSDGTASPGYAITIENP